MAMGLMSQLLLLASSLSRSNQFCDAGTSSKLLIKGGTVVNAHHQQVADVYVEDGIIVSIKSTIMVGDEVTVIDATGKFVMPGGTDPHTHLEFEFMGTETVDGFFGGQAAALAGGTTMHIDFVIPRKGSLTAGIEAYEKKARKSCMDYGFHIAITKWDETMSREMELMVKEKGTNSFKFFMAYKGALMINDEFLLEGFKKCKSLGALAMVHAENGDAVDEELGITGPEGQALSWPAVLEGEATARAIHLADFVNTPLYVVHVMSIDAMEEIAKARKSGQRVIGEPVASGLALDESWLWHPDFETAAKLLVGTDRCAFNSTQKALGIDDFQKIPNGVNGNHMMDGPRYFQPKCILGKVEVTIAGGRVVWENNELKVAHGTGRYIKMPPFSYLSDGIDKKGCLLSKLPPSPSGESQIQHLKSF
ncbi:hypothetical protein JHK82_021671 [Glycine max]|nr:hypothetical protein JHK82_021671 [Glycine max]